MQKFEWKCIYYRAGQLYNAQRSKKEALVGKIYKYCAPLYNAHKKGKLVSEDQFV